MKYLNKIQANMKKIVRAITKTDIYKLELVKFMHQL